jgi:hypothetical protein
MKIAIDIDGTISLNSDFFKRFIDNQMDAGNEIHILTGGKRDEEEDAINPEGRLRQLKGLGITRFTVVVQIVRKTQHPGIGIGKAEYCRDNGIDMIFEDDSLYILEIKRIAPNTQAFLIQ